MPTGMPRPLSTTRTPLSASSVTSMRVGVPGQGLVDGVVHNLVDEVVETTLSGRADVHTRALANRLKPFENGD